MHFGTARIVPNGEKDTEILLVPREMPENLLTNVSFKIS
jgi:hypothetical protein